jgi:acetylornithine deacetylase/succinyl-diaminopimelate desuccinylase-like protein
MHPVDDFVHANQERILGELIELLRIPSVSADPVHASDCRRAAEWVADHLRRLGCVAVRLLGSETHPVVHAVGAEAPGRPTLLVYGHYDVQPPEPLAEWTSPPFEPEIRHGDLYARGATDDKGQFLAIMKAWEAVASSGPPALNIRFLIEGEEESGGEVIRQLLGDDVELARADVALVADGPFYARGWPVAEVGVRGICYVEIVVRTLREDVHSGLYGGVAPNAHDVLVRILAALKGEGGRIRIPSAYEDIRRPSRRERESWSRLPFDIDVFMREEVGAAALIGDRRRSVHERVWALPTLDIHGITGGFTGDGAKTVIPAEARAKLSLRLVPDQRPDKVFRALESFVRSMAPPWAQVSVNPLILNDPALVDVTHPAYALLDAAFRDVVGRGISFTRSGGSLPVLSALGTGGAAVVLAGIGLPGDRLHAPDEHIALDQLFNGIRVFGRFLQSLADTRLEVTS